MKRTLLVVSLLASLVCSAALGFVAGRKVASSEAELARMAAIARTHELVASDLASTDATSRETALWYQAGAVLYGTDALAAMLDESGRARELMVSYARIAEHAAKDQATNRAQRLLGRAEEVCARSKLGACTSTEILVFLERLNQPVIPEAK
jgi:hypothetical protein